MLVAVMFLLALLIISLAVAVPRIKSEIQRDREEETMHRGKQYIRAIQLYYRKFHAYPPSIDALVQTQDIRFLRKRYLDPITGKDDWKPIQWGQNKAPTAMGFFGQPVGGTSLAGTGPSGGNGLNGAQGVNGQPGNSSAFGSNSSGFGSNSTGSSFFGSGSNGSGTNTGLFASPSSGSANANGSSDPNSPSGTGTGSGPGTGSGGQTFGGAGVIGFSPDSPKETILVYKKKTHYNEWEFVYDPIMDQTTMGAGGGGLNGQPVGNSPIGGTPGFGNTTGGNPNSPFGNNPQQNQPQQQPPQPQQ